MKSPRHFAEPSNQGLEHHNVIWQIPRNTVVAEFTLADRSQPFASVRLRRWYQSIQLLSQVFSRVNENSCHGCLPTDDNRQSPRSLDLGNVQAIQNKSATSPSKASSSTILLTEGMIENVIACPAAPGLFSGPCRISSGCRDRVCSAVLLSGRRGHPPLHASAIIHIATEVAVS